MQNGCRKHRKDSKRFSALIVENNCEQRYYNSVPLSSVDVVSIAIRSLLK